MSMSTATGKRILLIDDSPVFLEVERSFLAELSHEIATATSGVDGLEQIRSSPPDLVLLDHDMPDLSGLQVLEQMRATPELSGIPVILVSGTTTDDMLDRYMALGVSSYIPKSFTPEEILGAVGRALGVAERKKVSFLARLRRGDESTFVKALDLSTTGILVESNASLSPEESVTLEFFVPRTQTQLRIHAVVARELPFGAEEGVRRFGLKFLDLNGHARNLLASFTGRR